MRKDIGRVTACSELRFRRELERYATLTRRLVTEDQRKCLASIAADNITAKIERNEKKRL